MERVVLRLMCDDRGEITFLFGPWGAVDRAEAIRQIESGERRYTLQRPDGSRASIEIVDIGNAQQLDAFTQGSEILRPGDAVQIRA
jgi:hypothetical protein